MKDEELLDGLGRLAHEQDVTADPRWEALAEGTLSPEDEADLRAWAERSPAARAAYEALRPVDGPTLDAMTDAVLARTEKQDAPPRGGALVVPFRRRGRLVGAAAVALGIAAAAALLLRAPAPAPVAEYNLVLGQGDAPLRSGQPAVKGVPRLAPGSYFELIARPHEPVQGQVAVRAALVQDGQARAWDPPIRLTPDGTAHLEGPREAVFPGVPDGEWEIWLAIGRAESLPARLPAGPANGDVATVRILHARVSLAGELR